MKKYIFNGRVYTIRVIQSRKYKYCGSDIYKEIIFNSSVNDLEKVFKTQVLNYYKKKYGERYYIESFGAMHWKKAPLLGAFYNTFRVKLKFRNKKDKRFGFTYTVRLQDVTFK